MQSVKQELIYLPGVENNPQPRRWITASGVHAVSDEGHRLHGKVLAQNGYDPQLRERHLGSIGKSGE